MGLAPIEVQIEVQPVTQNRNDRDRSHWRYPDLIQA